MTTAFRLLRLLALALALSAAGLPHAAQAQDAASFPNKPLRIIVGFGPGGGNDIIARVIGQKLQESMGQNVLIENRPGAGGTLAGGYVAREPADGYTMLMGAAGAMAISPAVFEKMPYQTLKDFTPVSMIAAFPLILVTSPKHPAKTVRELVDWTKANAGKANYASSSPAFTLAVELFKLRTGAAGTAIPYKSSNESLVSVIGEQSVYTIVDPPPTAPQVRGGQLRGLAVMDSKRLPDLPDMPTIDEAGFPGVHIGLWTGLFVPAGTPKPIVAKLESEVRKALGLADVQEKFRTMATGIVASTSEEFAARIEKETKLYRDIAAEAKLKFGQ